MVKRISVEAANRRALQRAIRRRESVRIERTHDMSNVYGYPLAVSMELVLLEQTVDFRLDGYAVMPLRQIASVPALATQRFTDRVVSDRGDAKRIHIPRYRLALESWLECAKSVAAMPQFVICDCERRDGEIEDDFYLGSIVAVTNDSFAMRHVDAMAGWYSDVPVTPFADITRLRFGDPYSTTFRKYMKTLPPD